MTFQAEHSREPVLDLRRLIMQNRQGNGDGFHYGLEFVLSSSNEQIEDTVQRLERKQNRTKKANRANGKGSIKKLQRQLKNGVNSSAAKAIEAELNRKFRQLYRLRQKS